MTESATRWYQCVLIGKTALLQVEEMMDRKVGKVRKDLVKILKDIYGSRTYGKVTSQNRVEYILGARAFATMIRGSPRSPLRDRDVSTLVNLAIEDVILLLSGVNENPELRLIDAETRANSLAEEKRRSPSSSERSSRFSGSGNLTGSRERVERVEEVEEPRVFRSVRKTPGRVVRRSVIRDREEAYSSRFTEEGRRKVGVELLEMTPEEKKQYDFFQWTPLHMATIKNNVKLMKLYLEEGADTEASDKYDDKPIHWCITKDNLEGLYLLLEYGANIDSKGNRGWTALHYVCLQNKPEYMNILLELGADPNIRDVEGKTGIDCRGMLTESKIARSSGRFEQVEKTRSLTRRSRDRRVVRSIDHLRVDATSGRFTEEGRRSSSPRVEEVKFEERRHYYLPIGDVSKVTDVKVSELYNYSSPGMNTVHLVTLGFYRECPVLYVAGGYPIRVAVSPLPVTRDTGGYTNRRECLEFPQQIEYQYHPFGNHLNGNNDVVALVVDGQGRLVTGINPSFASSTTETSLITIRRYNVDGTEDTEFNKALASYLDKDKMWKRFNLNQSRGVNMHYLRDSSLLIGLDYGAVILPPEFPSGYPAKLIEWKPEIKHTHCYHKCPGILANGNIISEEGEYIGIYDKSTCELIARINSKFRPMTYNRGICTYKFCSEEGTIFFETMSQDNQVKMLEMYTSRGEYINGIQIPVTLDLRQVGLNKTLIGIQKIGEWEKRVVTVELV